MVSGEGVGTGSSELDDVLACAIRNVLGITDFYPPQAEGIEHGLTGKNLMLSIPTASGKSAVAYVCMLQKILRSEGSRGDLRSSAESLGQGEIHRNQKDVRGTKSDL